MPKRSQKGITSGVGPPNRGIGQNGDMTFRLTREGYILYVKENSQWYSINTGIDVKKLRKEVDRLIKSVSVLGQSSNRNNLTLGSLRLAKTVALATYDPKITFSIGTTDKFVMGIDDSDSDKLKIDTGGTIGGATKVTVDSSGNMTTAGSIDATKIKLSETSPGQGYIGSAGADSHFLRTNDGSQNYFAMMVNASNVVQGNPSGQTVKFFDNLFLIVDNSDSTKGVDFQVSGVSNGTTRTLTIPDADGTIALASSTSSGFITDSRADTMTVSDFGANAAFKIDADQPATTLAENSIGLHIDYVRAVATSGTNNHNDIGIDLDVTAATLGTGAVRGMDIDVVGATSGTHTAIGIDILAVGGDTNVGIVNNTFNGGIDYKQVSSADTGDYFTMTTIAAGATTLSTVDDGGAAAHLTLAPDGDIVLDSGTGIFIAKNAGTEFSVANSAYAGMILGYTRIQNDGTTSGHANITVNSSSMTVIQTAQGTDLSINFKVPPSGNVEIQCSFWMIASSDGAKFSLSTGTSYAELDETHTYDADYTVYIDETDHNYNTVHFSVTGLTPGTDTTYYLAGLASGAGVTISHGRNRTNGTFYPPIILRAIALPATIVAGE